MGAPSPGSCLDPAQGFSPHPTAAMARVLKARADGTSQGGRWLSVGTAPAQRGEGASEAVPPQAPFTGEGAQAGSAPAAGRGCWTRQPPLPPAGHRPHGQHPALAERRACPMGVGARPRPRSRGPGAVRGDAPPSPRLRCCSLRLPSCVTLRLESNWKLIFCYFVVFTFQGSNFRI